MKIIISSVIISILSFTQSVSQQVGKRKIARELNGISISFDYEEVKRCDLEKPNVKRLFKITVYLTNKNSETVVFSKKPRGFDPNDMEMGGSRTPCTTVLNPRPKNSSPYFSTTFGPGTEEHVVYYRGTANVEKIGAIYGYYLPSFSKKGLVNVNQDGLDNTVKNKENTEQKNEAIVQKPNAKNPTNSPPVESSSNKITASGNISSPVKQNLVLGDGSYVYSGIKKVLVDNKYYNDGYRVEFTKNKELFSGKWIYFHEEQKTVNEGDIHALTQLKIEGKNVTIVYQWEPAAKFIETYTGTISDDYQQIHLTKHLTSIISQSGDHRDNEEEENLILIRK